MIVIPPKKIESRGDSIQMFPADQDKFKTFYRDVRACLKSTRNTCLKEGYEGEPRKCLYSRYHEWPDSAPFCRFNHFCLSRNWTGEERGRYWKSCCAIRIVANTKYCGATWMREWRRYCREGEKDRSDLSRAIMNCSE